MRVFGSAFLYAFVLLSFGFAPTAAVWHGPDCPQNTTFDGLMFVGFVKSDLSTNCYIMYRNDSLSMSSLVHACKGLHRDAYPAVPQSQKEFDNIKSVVSKNFRYLTGISASHEGQLRDFNTRILNVSFNDLSVTPSTYLQIDNNGAHFSTESTTNVICEIASVPYPKTELPPPYIHDACPPEFMLYNFTSGKKCLKLYNTTVDLHRCTVNEWCKGAHSSALPASPRFDDEREAMAKLAPMVYIGIHARCDEVLQGSYGKSFTFYYPNGDVFDGKYHTGTDHSDIPEYLMAVGLRDNQFEDYPECWTDKPVLCEVTLAIRPDGDKCPVDYNLFESSQMCVHRFVYTPVVDPGKEGLQFGRKQQDPADFVEDYNYDDDDDATMTRFSALFFFLMAFVLA